MNTKMVDKIGISKLCILVYCGLLMVMSCESAPPKGYYANDSLTPPEPRATMIYPERLYAKFHDNVKVENSTLDTLSIVVYAHDVRTNNWTPIGSVVKKPNGSDGIADLDGYAHGKYFDAYAVTVHSTNKSAKYQVIAKAEDDDLEINVIPVDSSPTWE
jgi:hypothetical protein